MTYLFSSRMLLSWNVDRKPIFPASYTNTMTQKMLDKRKYERDNCTEIAHYAPYPYSSDTVLKGLMQDFSCSGLCLITRHALEEGQEIVLKSVILPNSKTAVVRWYQDLGNSAFKIGLEFRR